MKKVFLYSLFIFAFPVLARDIKNPDLKEFSMKMKESYQGGLSYTATSYSEGRQMEYIFFRKVNKYRVLGTVQREEIRSIFNGEKEITFVPETKEILDQSEILKKIIFYTSPNEIMNLNRCVTERKTDRNGTECQLFSCEAKSSQPLEMCIGLKYGIPVQIKTNNLTINIKNIKPAFISDSLFNLPKIEI